MRKDYLIDKLALNGNNINEYIDSANEIYYKTYKIDIQKNANNKYQWVLNDLIYGQYPIISKEEFDNKEDAGWKLLEELDVYVNIIDKY